MLKERLVLIVSLLAGGLLLVGCSSSTEDGADSQEATLSSADASACSPEDPCDFDEYCDYPDGECGTRGTCEPRPEICPTDINPVCGCDGRTYDNACLANKNGVDVAYEGECREPCSPEEPCASDEYCDYPDGQCNTQGTCEPRPEICPTDINPVCGCDGNTYENDCAAKSAGTDVNYEGRCQE